MLIRDCPTKHFLSHLHIYLTFFLEILKPLNENARM